MSKVAFLSRVLRAYVTGQSRGCPYCGLSDTRLLGRKHVIVQLRGCPGCQLKFRWPKESRASNVFYYQRAYREVDLTTDLPNPDALRRLLDAGFRGTPKDFSERIAVLKALLPGGKALDFGSSWGYAAYQLRQAGYDVTGFEISKLRAEYGRRHLGIPILDDYADLDRLPAGSFDLVFSSHVLEHLPDLGGIFERFRDLLRPQGLLVILVPNCGGANARQLGLGWGPMVNEKHTMAFEREFFAATLPALGFTPRAYSEPYEPLAILADIDGPGRDVEPQGDELMILARKTSG